MISETTAFWDIDPETEEVRELDSYTNYYEE